MTCFAVCAAIRPKSIGGKGSTIYSPSRRSERKRRTISNAICVSSFSTRRTTSVQRARRTSPVRRSMVARMSFSWPYLARPAFCIACSIASSTSSRSIPFSRETASATNNNSGRKTEVSIFLLSNQKLHLISNIVYHHARANTLFLRLISFAPYYLLAYCQICF